VFLFAWFGTGSAVLVLCLPSPLVALSFAFTFALICVAPNKAEIKEPQKLESVADR
jgi:hypothetical protein